MHSLKRRISLAIHPILMLDEAMEGGQVKKLKNQAWKVFNSDEVQDALPRIRSRLYVPPRGIASENEYNEWRWEREDGMRLAKELFTECVRIVDQYLLHPDTVFLIRDLILFDTNDFRPNEEIMDVTVPMEDMGVCELVVADGQLANWKKGKQSFALLVISEYASQRDAKEFLVKNWKRIKSLIAQQQCAKDTKALRATQSSKYDSKIITEARRLGKMGIEELREIAPKSEFGGYVYSADAISAIIKKKYRKSINPDYIPKLISRNKSPRTRSEGH